MEKLEDILTRLANKVAKEYVGHRTVASTRSTCGAGLRCRRLLDLTVNHDFASNRRSQALGK